MIDQTQTGTMPGAMPAGFCQQCGKPLDQHTIRKVGTAVFCEPCLAAKLGTPPAAAAAPPTGAAGGYSGGYGPVRVGVNWRAGAGAGGFTTEDLNRPGPNPGRAFLLGLIPGVGAMYNEQYDKGLVHLAIFVVLESLARVSSGFGIFVVGWIFYMAIEAHHTARARRDGTPLPNPFGLNDIGVRLGFDRWGHAGGPARPAAAPVPPAAAATASAPPDSASWGAPADVYPNPVSTPVEPAQPVTPPAGYTPPQVPPYGAPTQAHVAQAAWSVPRTPYTNPQQPPNPAYPPYPPPYGAPMPHYTQPAGYAVPPVPPMPRPAHFPIGALWLIGFGTLFLLSSTGTFSWVNAYSLVGFGLLGLAVWSFLRCSMNPPAYLRGADDALPRLVRALRSSVWIALTGLLIILDAFHILGWAHSWPLYLILSGAMALLGRVAATGRSQQPPVQPIPDPVAPAPDPTPRASFNGDWNHTPGAAATEHQGDR